MFAIVFCVFGVGVGLVLAHGEHTAQARSALLPLFIAAISVGVALALFGTS